MPEPLLPLSRRRLSLGRGWLSRLAGSRGWRRRRLVPLTAGSGSRISALNPLPNAFLGICDNLLGELNIAFSAFTMYVVEHYWHAVARCFCQADILGITVSNT